MAHKDLQIAEKNKEKYLKAKEAFNKNEMEECLSYYSPNHKISGGQQGTIRLFLEGIQHTWLGIQIIIEEVLAEGDMVMAKCKAIATHSNNVRGVPASHKQIQTSFWDLHRFDENGKVIETWNILDNLPIMQQLGLISATK